MLTVSEARKIINDHVKLFLVDNPIAIQWTNQKDFIPPKNQMWCRITTPYTDTQQAGLYRGQLERDYGFISIQCFCPLGWGDLAVTELADKWRKHWRGFVKSHFEIERTHAPTEVLQELDAQYSMVLLRIEFRVN